MSCTEINIFDNSGESVDTFEVKNAFRGAMAIWGILEKKYLPEYVPDWAKVLSDEGRRNIFKDGISRIVNGDMQDVWNLQNDNRLSRHEKIVLLSTFDNVLVKKENFNELIEAFEQFEGETSLKEQSEIIKNLGDNITAIGWNQTSVCHNKWNGFIIESDDEDILIKYNYHKDTDHWWMFDHESLKIGKDD